MGNNFPRELLNFNADGAMIRTRDVALDESALEPGTQRGGDEEIINAPADVPGAGVGHRTPPSVMPARRLELPKCVEEAGFDEGIETTALLDGETVIADIGFGIGQVQIGVRDVQVAATDHRIIALEL